MTKDWCSSSPSCWEQTLEIWSQRYMVSPKMVFPHLPHIFTVWQKSKPLPSAPSSAVCSQMPLQSMPCMRQLLGKLGDRPWTAGAGWLEAPGNKAQWAGSSRDISAAWGTNTTYCWFKSRASTGLPTYTWERMKKPLLVSRSKEHRCTLPSNNCRKDILHSPIQEFNWFFQREDSNKTWSKFTMPIWR